MAKQITKTVGKYSSSHDRMTLTFKFPNGENLRINSSRSRASMSYTAPAGMVPPTQAEMQKILTLSDKFTPADKTREDIFKRVLAFGEKFDDIKAFAAAI